VEGAAAAGGLPAVTDFACRVPRQHYSLGAIGWFIELVLAAPCSQRAAAAIVGWVSRLWAGWHQTPAATAPSLQNKTSNPPPPRALGVFSSPINHPQPRSTCALDWRSHRNVRPGLFPLHQSV
jgi:hypothetical protein